MSKRRAPRTFNEHRLGYEPEMKAALAAIGKALSAYRASAGLSLTAMAEKIGCSMTTIHSIEQGRNWLSLPVYLKLCRVMGLPKPPMT